MTFFAGQRLTAALLNAFSSPGAWQTAALLNSWTGAGAGGVNGLFYRRSLGGIDVDIVADIINTTATGNSICATLPAGFVPSSIQNFPLSWNNPTNGGSGSLTPSAPWVNVNTSGNITLAGIQAANKEIFFGFTLRLGSI